MKKLHAVLMSFVLCAVSSLPLATVKGQNGPKGQNDVAQQTPRPRLRGRAAAGGRNGRRGTRETVGHFEEADQ